MLLPVGRIDVGILDRISTMDHHSISNIDSYMTGSWCVISFLKEDQISRFRLIWRYISTDSTKPFCSPATIVPSIAAVINHPGHKSRAIKTCRWGCPAPDIWITKIFLCFTDHVRKSLIRQCFRWNVIAHAATAAWNRPKVKQIISVSVGGI